LLGISSAAAPDDFNQFLLGRLSANGAPFLSEGGLVYYSRLLGMSFDYYSQNGSGCQIRA
jgi:hypothetical protein